MKSNPYINFIENEYWPNMLNSLKSLIAYRNGRRMNQRIGNKMDRGRKNIEEGIKKEVALDG